MKNNKTKLLLIFFISIFTSNVFGIDYFWPTGIPLKDGSRLGGVNIEKISDNKIKKFFNKKLKIIGYTKSKGVFQQKTHEVTLSDKLFTFDEEYNTGDDHVGIYLTRILGIRLEDAKKSNGFVAIPSKYKVEDVKILNLKRSTITDMHKPYIDAIKNSGGVIPDKTAKYMLSKQDSLVIYEDRDERNKFAIIRGVVFLNETPVFYNDSAFAPIFSHKEIKSFLLKIDGKVFFLGCFPLSVLKNGQRKNMDSYYYLVDLEEGKAYLPMHLREEK